MPQSAAPRLLLTDPDHVDVGVARLMAGEPVAHGFGGLYAITARGDDLTIASVNRWKGRPAGQVGSVVVPPEGVPAVFDWSQLPPSVAPDRLGATMRALWSLGPFGFRGPAASGLPRLLTSTDQDTLTTQLIAPGRACPSNAFLRRAYFATGAPLYITSANRSRHVSGGADAPAHWRADRLGAEFDTADSGRPLTLLEHADETQARDEYPRHLPMSTTILAFHQRREVDGRPALVVERHGSLHLGEVARVVGRFGFVVVVERRAMTRLAPRDYGDVSMGHVRI
jgi:tRNA A37 threonylcarbamoyladenosine synthetase subunit TsaC/SUA5/YrdC